MGIVLHAKTSAPLDSTQQRHPSTDPNQFYACLYSKKNNEDLLAYHTSSSNNIVSSADRLATKAATVVGWATAVEQSTTITMTISDIVIAAA